MELAHSLLLNEDALAQITEAKRPVFIFEWLRFLNKVLVAANKVDVKEKQKKLVEQLTSLISSNPGPPTRKLLAKNLATLYSIGDTFTVFQTLDKCNDIIKNKDDTPAYLPTKLAAVACVGAFYERMGRMLGSSFPETINNLLKALKNAESQGRGEILLSLQKVLSGLGAAAASCHRDIYKNARSLLTDRSMAVRCAVAKCLLELQNEAVFMWTAELENVATLCFKALEGSTYGVRVAVSKLLGTVMATALMPKQAAVMRQNVKRATLDEVLELMATGFLRGGSSFLKSGGEMLKGGTSVSREVRVGVTEAYVVFVTVLGGQWLERNFATFLSHLLELVAHPRATQSHVEAVYSRRCVSFALRATLGALLGEKAQIAAAKDICQAISKQMRAVEAVVSDSSGENKGTAADVSASQHVMVCALKELGSLVQSLSATAAPLIQEPSIGLLETVMSVLLHPSMAARLAAAWCLRCVAVALPNQLTPLLDRCAERINALKSSPEAVSGYSFAMAALLGAVHQCPLGIPHSKGKMVVSIAEDLLRSAAQNSRLSLHRTQAGWLLLGALMTLGSSLVRYHLPKMLLLWRNVFPRSQKELEAEKARGDSFTWQVTLEGRAGALCAMRSFVAHCPELLTEDVIRRLMTPIECAMTMMAHSNRRFRLRGSCPDESLYFQRSCRYKGPWCSSEGQCSDGSPPSLRHPRPPSSENIRRQVLPSAESHLAHKSCSFSALLRELVAEFTLTDNSSNTTTSLLRSLCHYDDSVLMGSWLQETDHKSIEDQLQPNSASGSGALEHDPSSIYLRVPVGEAVPGPLPLGVSVIDASVALFGVVFPHVSFKHRLQMLDHFAECVKQAKGVRQQAVQLNIFTAVLSALKVEQESRVRESSNKVEQQSRVRESSNEVEQESRVRESSNKVEQESRVREWSNKVEQESRVREWSNKVEQESRVREWSNKVEQESRVREWSNKVEQESRVRESSNKVEQESRVREWSNKVEQESRVRESSNKVEQESRVRESSNKVEQESRVRESSNKVEQESRVRESSNKVEQESRVREWSNKVEQQSRVRESSNKVEQESRVREWSNKVEQESRVREWSNKVEQESRVREWSNKVEQESRVREWSNKVEQESRVRESSNKVEQESRVREWSNKVEQESRVREWSNKVEQESRVRESSNKVEQESRVREWSNKVEQESRVRESSKKAEQKSQGLAENKSTLGPEEVRKSALALVMGALDNPNPILRCAAGEALGRMAQVVGEATFIASMAQHSFDKLKSARDVVSRTGHSLALGCLHRYVGGIGSGQHLKTSVSILLALAQDATSHEVQTWALHSLALIVDSSGPMYRGYVEPTLSLVLTLLLTVPPSHTEVHQCLGRCLGALITTVGPELQGNSVTISTIRSSCLVGCAIMQDHSDSLVQAAAISCLQQLHMFAPRHVNLSSLVPCLCVHLCSSHLLLRRAAVACLRQLAQREAAEVCEYAMSLAKKAGDNKDSATLNLNISETGLEGVLFGMLDRETDRKLCSDIHDTLGHMLSSLAVGKLSHWLKLCKDVLAASTEVGGAVAFEVEKEEDSEKKDEMDDDIMFTGLGEDDKSKPSVAPRWVTRVFAADCLCRIIHLCENADKTHFDLAAARTAKAKNPKGDLLVLHLSDLIRMAFMAATDHSHQLRMAGLQALEDIIKKFASVPEPEFPGHVILEQYQANVGAALRPAFSPDTPSDITAKACQVCSAWIGSGVVSDLNDLRRVHNLLVSSLDKVQAGKGSSSQLYSESATTMEKLAVLKAWAEEQVYVVAMKLKKEAESRPARPVRGGEDDDDEEDVSDEGDVLPADSLITLVQPELPSLSRLWLAALRDYALLTLPAEFASQLPPEGGAFYTPETIDTARLHYRSSWAPILHAVALWLSTTDFGAPDCPEEPQNATSTGPAGFPQGPAAPSKSHDELVKDRMHLLLGVSIEFLCFPRPEEPIERVMSCLKALSTLLECPRARKHIAEDQLLAVELLNVLHRLLLTRDPPSVQLQVTAVVQETIRSAHEHLEQLRSSESAEEGGEKEWPRLLGEGGDSGELQPGKSLVFAAMELLVFLLVRHLPQISAKASDSPSHVPIKPQQLSEHSNRLLAVTVGILAELPALCSPAGSMTILPTALFLICGVLRETAVKTADSVVSPPVSASLQAIKTIITSPLSRVGHIQQQWSSLVRSSLASVLEYSQPDESRPSVDEVSMLTAITLFLVSAGSELLGVTSLQKGCMERFRNALNSSDPLVQLRCYQLLLSVFQHSVRALSTPYIHALAPALVEKLKAAERSRPSTPAELHALQEGVRVLEGLVGLGEEQNRVQLLALLVPTLISYLLDENTFSSAPPTSKALHEFALQNLMRIGPLYPAAFKTVMGAAPELKPRLEAAIRADQASNKAKAMARQTQPTVQATPTIKLKTSFF
ncbi:hypothetical protein QTP86_029603 [Hemibagrus guttatus]|nr:hypothetical protein QTP86_029603 [Hemibagrus guttatus]